VRERENKRNGIDSDHINSYNKKQQPNNPPEIDVINGLNLEVRTRWPKRPKEQRKDKKQGTQMELTNSSRKLPVWLSPEFQFHFHSVNVKKKLESTSIIHSIQQKNLLLIE